MMIAKDKIYHLIAGFIVAIVSSFILHDAIYGIFFGALAGIGKEVYDWFTKRGVVDRMDIAYTVVGSIIGSGVVFWML